MWGQDSDYSDLMRELWGSPERWNVRKTYTDVASKLGIDEETVRNRLKRLRESGFLLGWRVIPNQTLFGREPMFLYLELGNVAEADKAVELLKRYDGVHTIARLFGNLLLVAIYDDASHASSGRIAGLGMGRIRMLAPGMQVPQTSYAMASLDWRILNRILRDAEMHLSSVAASVGVSKRTVKNRLNRMMDASAIFVTPMTDVRRAVGVQYQLIVDCDEGSSPEVSRIVSSKIGRVIFRASDSGSGLIFGFNGRNVSEGSDLERWLEQQPHILSARINMVESVVYAFDWLERETERCGAERDWSAYRKRAGSSSSP